ncbi:MAG: hypothetical protein Ta2E_12760 [Mycoplasmoidaceae bacterium]|nr:MAG: hypothetical protein Ta2E_12760 [Mycoplasmoidaceae bacterium]
MNSSIRVKLQERHNDLLNSTELRLKEKEKEKVILTLGKIELATTIAKKYNKFPDNSVEQWTKKWRKDRQIRNKNCVVGFETYHEELWSIGVRKVLWSWKEIEWINSRSIDWRKFYWI